MNYDEMILDCQGDCDKCDVMLECQYQTSDGEEKQKYLKLLEERDQKAVEGLNEACAKDLTEEVTSESHAETTEQEVASENKEKVEAETEAEKEAEAVAISDEEIKKIYDSVFGLNKIEACEASEKADDLAKTTQEPEREIEETSQNSEVVSAEKEVVDGIFTEVFGLSEEAKTEETIEELAKPEAIGEPKTPIEAVTETLDNKEEAACQEEVIPATKDVVDGIFVEVFGLSEATETEAKPEEATETEAETTNEVVTEPTAETTAEVESVTETITETATEAAPVTETQAETTETTASVEGAEGESGDEEPAQKATFKLVPPENNEELMARMCAKRARKLIYRPSETLISATFKVLGTEKKNEVGEKIKDVIDAEIKQGVKVGYLDKFDGLSSAEIKEEYENDIVYEYADQEFKKTGVIYDGKKIRVYIYDWDGKACHHVGYIDETEAKEFIPYFVDKEKYSFDVCGIITGGKGKRVTRVGDTLKITKEKGDPIGIDVDIAIINRKD